LAIFRSNLLLVVLQNLSEVSLQCIWEIVISVWHCAHQH